MCQMNLSQFGLAPLEADDCKRCMLVDLGTALGDEQVTMVTMDEKSMNIRNILTSQ